MLNFNFTEKKIIKYILENGKVFQNDIQNNLELDKSNLSRFLSSCLSKEILLKDKIGKRNLFYFNKNRKYYINFEWNRKKLECHITNLYGEIVETISIFSLDYEDFGSFYNSIYMGINLSLNKYPITSFIGICFCIHGILSDNNIIRYVPSCPWKNIDLIKICKDISPLEVFIENYTNLGAYYEKMIFYPEHTSLTLVKIQTGIGGGLVIENKIYSGHNGGALEVGHLTLTPDSNVEYVDIIEEEFMLKKLEEFGFKNLEEFILAYKTNNSKASELYKLFLKNWIFILRNLVSIINPSVLVLYHVIFNNFPHCIFEIQSAFENSLTKPKIISFSNVPLKEYHRGINILLFNTKFDFNISRLTLI